MRVHLNCFNLSGSNVCYVGWGGYYELGACGRDGEIDAKLLVSRNEKFDERDAGRQGCGHRELQCWLHSQWCPTSPQHSQVSSVHFVEKATSIAYLVPGIRQSYFSRVSCPGWLYSDHIMTSYQYTFQPLLTIWGSICHRTSLLERNAGIKGLLLVLFLSLPTFHIQSTMTIWRILFSILKVPLAFNFTVISP